MLILQKDWVWHFEVKYLAHSMWNTCSVGREKASRTVIFRIHYYPTDVKQGYHSHTIGGGAEFWLGGDRARRPHVGPGAAPDFQVGVLWPRLGGSGRADPSQSPIAVHVNEAYNEL